MGMPASKRCPRKKKAIKISHKSTRLTRPSNNKLELHESRKLPKTIVSEISGFAAYELKAIEMLKRDEDKKCKRFLKNGWVGWVLRIGSWISWLWLPGRSRYFISSFYGK